MVRCSELFYLLKNSDGNRVLHGRLVQEYEYKDLSDIMNTVGLFEVDSRGNWYTWSNKQNDNIIYSGIDIVTGNLDWL